MSVAEVLDDADRDALAADFAAPVVQVYQATEGLLGLPCAAGELHLCEDHVAFDLEEVGEGLVRPVITDLRRRAQPMVRHQLTDLLEVADGCACGQATRRVVRIAGRSDDALVLPGTKGERTLWPDFLRAALSRVPGLEEYRLTQTRIATRERPAHLVLEVEPRAVAEDAERRVLAELARQGVDLAHVTLARSPWRPSPAGTKLRRVVRVLDDQ